jgi:hypothetical protein
VLDHYLLWATFGAVGPDVQASPALLYFPDEAARNAYFAGLTAADNRRNEKIRGYYEARLIAAMSALRGAPQSEPHG